MSTTYSAFRTSGTRIRAREDDAHCAESLVPRRHYLSTTYSEFLTASTRIRARKDDACCVDNLLPHWHYLSTTYSAFPTLSTRTRAREDARCVEGLVPRWRYPLTTCSLAALVRFGGGSRSTGQGGFGPSAAGAGRVDTYCASVFSKVAISPEIRVVRPGRLPTGSSMRLHFPRYRAHRTAAASGGTASSVVEPWAP